MCLTSGKVEIYTERLEGDMAACTLRIFGRPLADLTPSNADAIRSHLAELDACTACQSFTQRRADALADIDIQVVAMAAADAVAGCTTEVW